MIKIGLATHAEVLSQTGSRYYVVSPAGSVYATLCVNGETSYECITDEEPGNVLQPTDPLLSGAMQVASFTLI